MGYGEVKCEFCGVSFNIARIRTPDEPRDAAWNGYGTHLREPYIQYSGPGLSWIEPGHPHGHHTKCAGCSLARRTKAEERDLRPPQHHEPIAVDDEDLMDEDPTDEDWIPNDQVTADVESLVAVGPPKPCESCSTCGSCHVHRRCRCHQPEVILDDGEIAFSDHESDIMSEDSDTLSVGQGARQEFETFRQATVTLGRRRASPPIEDLFLPVVDFKYNYGLRRHEAQIDAPEYQFTEGSNSWEHVAGAECLNVSGYNGHNISVVEMRFCHTSQCLVRKPQAWTPEEDDELFEKTSEFFLSGLCDAMPSTDWGNPETIPTRHGNHQPWASNFMIDDRARSTAMAFHPYCFEVFKRASLFKTGAIDMNALTSWWTITAANWSVPYSKHSIPRHPAVKRGSDQWWAHHSGDEWLVANPLFVPALPQILQQADRRFDPNFDKEQDAFAERNEYGSELATHPSDIFTLLPDELLTVILSQLDSLSIASLRLASRTFVHLSQSLFQKLLLKEAPWLWEIWDDTPYSKWASETASALSRLEKEKHDQFTEIDNILNQLDHDDLPAIHLLKGHKEQITKKYMRIRAERDKVEITNALVPGKIDYYKLYLEMTRNWPNLEGLRNRARIWTDCEEILRQIQELRESGEPLENQKVDEIFRVARDRLVEYNRRRAEEYEARRRDEELRKEVERKEAELREVENANAISPTGQEVPATGGIPPGRNGPRKATGGKPPQRT